MSKQLYEEAIADLKKVKEIAEDNAKRAVVEAVAPRIRELIEKELLGESMENETAEIEDPEKKEKILTDTEKDSDDAETETLDLDSSDKAVESVSFVEVATEAANNSNELDQKLLYVKEMLNKLSDVTESSDVDSDLLQIDESINAIYEYVNENVKDPTIKLGYDLKLKKCLEQFEKIQETKMKLDLLNEEDVTLELTGLPDDIDLESLGVNLISKAGGEESKESSEEADEKSTDAEMGAEMGKEDEEELDLDLGDEAEDSEEDSEESDEEKMEAMKHDLDEDMTVEIDENMLREEIANMKALREEKHNEVGAMGHGPGEVSDEFTEEDMGDALELDLSEALASLEETADNKEGYGMAAQSYELEDYTPEAMVHEAEEETEEKEEPKSDKEEKSEASEKGDEDSDDDLEEMTGMGQGAKHRAGGAGYDVKLLQPNVQQNESIRSEMAKELELQESLRKRASQLKKLYEASKKSSTTAKTLVERKQAATKSDEVKASYTTTAKRYNDSVTRFNKLSQSLSEGSVEGNDSNSVAQSGASADQIDMLSKKLAETNLFNAKLLFTNKLLQNESLTARQKAQVIEQLDSAETIREAKLVYESLAKTLVKPRKTVTEGRILGSSSQATRPASTQTLNEGVEAERWAKLAGIK